MGPQRFIRRQEGKAAAAQRSYALDSDKHKDSWSRPLCSAGAFSLKFTQSRSFIDTRWVFLCSNIAVTSVDLDCRQLDGFSPAQHDRPTTSALDVPRAGGEGDISLTLAPTGRLEDYDAIESLDASDPPPTEVPVTAGLEPAPDFNGTQAASQGKARFRSALVDVK